LCKGDQFCEVKGTGLFGAQGLFQLLKESLVTYDMHAKKVFY